MFARNHIRLPMVGMSLADVADYFGIAHTTAIEDGFQALSMYRRYRRELSATAKRQLRADLVEYNLQDLKVLVDVIPRLRSIALGKGLEPAGRLT